MTFSTNSFGSPQTTMTAVRFETIKDLRHQADIVAMMNALYAEDQPASPVDHARFPRTVEQLVATPERGRIIVFFAEGAIRGYALLIPYWSNEFGGTLLIVDELFVIGAARNRGIARRFFEFVERERPFDAVALALEVSPANVRARKLYESLGFTQRGNATLAVRLAPLRIAAV